MTFRLIPHSTEPVSANGASPHQGEPFQRVTDQGSVSGEDQDRNDDEPPSDNHAGTVESLYPRVPPVFSLVLAVLQDPLVMSIHDLQALAHMLRGNLRREVYLGTG